MAGKGRGIGRGTDYGSDSSNYWEPQRPAMVPKGRGRGLPVPNEEGLVFENHAGGWSAGFGATAENKASDPWNWPIEESLTRSEVGSGFGENKTVTASGGGSNTFGGGAVDSGGFGSGFGSSNQGFGSGGFGGGGFSSSNRGYDSGGFGGERSGGSGRGTGGGFSSSSRGYGRGGNGFSSGGFGGGGFDRPGSNGGGFGSGGFSSGGGGFESSNRGFGSSGFGGGFSSGAGTAGDELTVVPASSSEKRGYGTGFKKSKGGFGSDADLGYASRKKDLPIIIKDFYVEDPEVTAMSDDEVAALRLALNNIAVTDTTGDRKPPKPVKTFVQAFRSYPEILEQIELQGFRQPTPIQCQMWPLALGGNDTIGIAQTGTGKTLGFLLPIFIHLDNQPGKRVDGPGAVILTPTRELAQQIHSEVKKYRYKQMKSVCVYGGAGNRQRQQQACEEGVDIVIATPGRLQDFTSNDVIDLSTVTFVVLDEADRMLDMGFEPDIRSIMMDIRDDRQTILTSATWPEAVRNLATSYTKDAFLISVGSLDLSAVHTVKQQVFILSNDMKKEFLLEFLFKMKPNEKVIVFVATKRSVDYLANYLNGRGLKCAYMHGDRDQMDREKALKDLKKGHVRILVATDVASRGLDISDITHVFNYDFPTNIEEYVHRVGRTGRAGKAGVAITIMTQSDWHLSTKLISILMEANQEIPEDLSRLSEQYEEQKVLLGADAVDPRPRRRRDERENRRARTDYSMFDPYTGEPL